MLIKKFTAISAMAVLLCINNNIAIAGLFDDDEARRLANEAKQQAENNMQQNANSLVELHNLVQQQTDELAKLRGQVEKLTYDLEMLQQRQQDLYVDIDSRIQNLEGGKKPSPNSATNNKNNENIANANANEATNTQNSNSNNKKEIAAYESALNQFKETKYTASITAFNVFIKNYPKSSLLPNAYYWLGNAYYAQGDCKSAITTQKTITTKFAEHSKAADAWLAIATCQQEIGDKTSAKKSFQTVINDYANTPAAEKAQKRLDNLSK